MTKKQASNFLYGIQSRINMSLRGYPVKFELSDKVRPGFGGTMFCNDEKSLVSRVGIRGFAKWQTVFGWADASDIAFANAAVAEFHESEHIRQRLAQMGLLDNGDPLCGMYYMVHDFNENLYDSHYWNDFMEVGAEIYGVREFGKWCEQHFGSDGLAVEYVARRVDDKHSYWLTRQDFLNAGVNFENMGLDDVLSVFERKSEDLLNMRYWYENRPHKNDDLVRQVLDMDNRDGFQKWGKVFDELCECRGFEESCKKISSLCLLARPEKRDCYSGVENLDAKKEIQSFIPESEKSIRERCSRNPDAKRVYRIDQAQVQEKYGDAIAKARQFACGPINKQQSVPVSAPKPIPMWEPSLPPPPMLPEDVPEVPDVGHDGPEF